MLYRSMRASVENCALPESIGNNLIVGPNSSYIPALVERHRHYVMLAKVKNKDTESFMSR